MENERDLICACAEGSHDAWDRFVARYNRLLYATAYAVRESCGTRCDERDMVGHVYEKLLENGCRRLVLWRGQSRLTTYLVQVTRNLCLDLVKAYARETRVPNIGDEFNPEKKQSGVWRSVFESQEDAAHHQNQQAALLAAIGKLPPKQAMIMRMRLEGCSLRQIAKTLGMPDGTVAAENSRAIERLRKAMTGSGLGPEKGADQ